MTENKSKDTGAGKGDAPRPVKGKEYRDNYDKIFKKDKKKG